MRVNDVLVFKGSDEFLDPLTHLKKLDPEALKYTTA
jgi:hypothetical protein